MRQEIALQRIAKHTGLDPLVFARMMAREIPFPDGCLLWEGPVHTKQGLVRQRHLVVAVKARPKIAGQYVNRFLAAILQNISPRLTSSCGQGLCVNPDHWIAEEAPAPPAPPPDAGWTYEEAEEAVDYYLSKNRYPLDPTHNLLMDIPPSLLARFKRP